MLAAMDQPSEIVLVSTPHPGGRPTHYNAGIALAICELIAQGNSLRAIDKMAGMPSRGTVMLWLLKHPEFVEQYRTAKQVYAEGHVESIIDLSDEATPEDVTVKKLQIDTRRWMGSKLLPKRYGEKVEVEHTIRAEEEDQTAICRRMAYMLARNVDLPVIEATPAIESDAPVESPNEP